MISFIIVFIVYFVGLYLYLYIPISKTNNNVFRTLRHSERSI